MERVERIILWIVLLVLLAGATFSYAHLRQVDPWAVETLAESVCRWVTAQLGALDYGVAGCATSAVVALAGLASALANLGKRRKPALTEGVPRKRP